MNLFNKMLLYLNLEDQIDDFDKIHETIEKDILFRGTNLWILIFAIIVASVGLNMNSTAVIIGAMLISPLMGPINGMGYSVATYNFPLLRRSVKNFSFAVIASLFASTLYFAVSPVSTAHSELLARTSPTIYDVLIALFGGLAGIVAITGKNKGNVIPGVAIATALMPPLCTAGYGLATAQFTYFFGAIYLFTINTVFIALSSVAISQILKFPIRTIVDLAQRKRVNQWISLVIAVTVIPSIYFGYLLVQKEKFTENANRFTRNVSVYEGNYLLRHEIDPQKKSILLVYGGSDLSENQKENLKEKAKDFSLENAEITFQVGLSFDEINNKRSEVDNLKAEIARLNQLLLEEEKRQDSIRQHQEIGRVLLEEIKTIFPQITSCIYGRSAFYNDSLQIFEKMDLAVLGHGEQKLKPEEAQKIENWLKTRLRTDRVRVFFE